MTTEELALSPAEERGAEPKEAQLVACAFCRRRLADEFFFTCRKCNASYCYIHMSRHLPTLCARQVARRQRARAAVSVPQPQPQNRDAGLQGGNQLLEVRLDSGHGSSANV